MTKSKSEVLYNWLVDPLAILWVVLFVTWCCLR